MNEDKVKRDAAVDAYAEAIKSRLDDKAKEGYVGWDGEYQTDDLIDEIVEDAPRLYSPTGTTAVIDIGARCMMVWKRQQAKLKGV